MSLPLHTRGTFGDERFDDASTRYDVDEEVEDDSPRPRTRYGSHPHHHNHNRHNNNNNKRNLTSDGGDDSENEATVIERKLRRYLERDTGPSEDVPVERLKIFMNPYDGRFEDLRSWSHLLRDFTSGLVVAMIAIPLAMGFAIASGVRPVHGIVGGAVAAFIGAAYGGSKYQVYGPTATLVPVIAAIMRSYAEDDYELGHGVLVSISIASGICLMLMGFARVGRIIHLVPHSIVVGFTNGIAINIFFSQLEETLGIRESLDSEFFAKLRGLADHIDDFNIWCLGISLFTAVMIKVFFMISLYIPGPLIVMAACTLLERYVLYDRNIILVEDKYGPIPSHLLKFTSPRLPFLDIEVLLNLCYHTLGIIFVSALESLLCSRMADRLAKNKGQPCNPNKDLWGQGMANLCVPLLNGFPNSGALMRTAINIECGAVSPMSGIFMCFTQLLIAFTLARFLEQIPMACVGGVLIYVAFSMVSIEEIRGVLAGDSKFHVFLMLWCTVVVAVTNFLVGVLSGIIIYALFHWCADGRGRYEEVGNNANYDVEASVSKMKMKNKQKQQQKTKEKPSGTEDQPLLRFGGLKVYS